MNQYNFNVLTWEEFEEFTKDLLSAEMDVVFQSFANGPDGGVDLRYSSGGDARDIVVQCKRYKNVPSLMSNLTKERAKLDTMKPKPKRYILTVSLDISETKVNEIAALFSPYLLSADDIITPKQLNTMLSRHQTIERRHYKLWLASSNVLRTILSSRVVNYTSLIQESIESTLKLYSPTPSFGEAMSALKENGFIVIAGEPGVGKTTLAQVMSFYLLGDKDFDELIALPQDINDALEMMSSNPEKKQLFLFDDFLGSNYLDYKLSRREDSVFKSLIENIGHLKKNKALIMTTREYILHQAQQSTEVFKDQEFLDAEYIINLSKYDATTKARILYNHLASSDIPDKHLEYFVSERVYRDVINHRNYSPRLIGAINKQKLWQGRTPEAFSDMVIDLFENPWTLYEDVYVNKIDEKERNVMLVMMSIGKEIRFDYLHRAVVSFDETIDETQLGRSIDILENTFLKTSKDGSGHIVVDVLNPTIYDFVTHYHRNHFHSLQKLIESAVYLNQLTHTFVIDKDNLSYEVRSSLSGYDPILLDESSAIVFKDKVLRDWRKLAWIGSRAIPDDFDIFDSLSRLLDSSIEIEEVKLDLSKKLLEDLEKSAIPTRDVQSALNIFDYYFEPEDISETVATHFVESITSSFVDYEDLKAIAEIGWNRDMKGAMSDMIINEISARSDHLDILDEEIRQRLSDDQDEQSIKEEMEETLAYFGLGSTFIDEIFVRWSEPPEDYDGSSFYSKDDDEFESHRDSESDIDVTIDNIFESLLSK